MSKKPKQTKPIVKVPKGRIGRAMFAGSQIVGAITVVRRIRDARTKGDKLGLAYGALSAATLAVTALIAVRTARASDAAKSTDSAAASAEPVLAAADR
jgi:hypothetical protein